MCYTVAVDAKGSILGIDFGLKRMGFALCDSMRILSSPLCVYTTKSMRDSIDYSAALAVKHGVVGIVVGLPLNLDGTESIQSCRVRAFAHNLEKVTGLSVELHDERLSTLEADELLDQAGVKKSARANIIDSMAAAVILQSYIDNNQNA